MLLLVQNRRLQSILCQNFSNSVAHSHNGARHQSQGREVLRKISFSESLLN